MTDPSPKPYDSTADTLAHIRQVRERMAEITLDLDRRAQVHDKSKLQEPEKSAFDACTHKLKAMAYGSPEYYEALQELKPALDHHYAHNDHHPEFHPASVRGMSLLSLMEMLADWKAATERMENGDIRRSLALNRGRFHISESLYDVLLKTVDELGW